MNFRFLFLIAALLPRELRGFFVGCSSRTKRSSDRHCASLFTRKNDHDDGNIFLRPFQSIQNSLGFQWKEFQTAKNDGFGTKARNAAINATVGDILVPICSDLEMRQSLANRGIYAGVEYEVCSLFIRVPDEEGEGKSKSSIESLKGLDLQSKQGVEALVRPRYPLRDYLERNDWPVSVELEEIPLWLSRATYEASTAVGTLFFSVSSLLLAAIVAFFVQFVSVPTASMIPALNPGNIVLVTRNIKPFSHPKVNDIVFFDAPSELETVVAKLSSSSTSSELNGAEIASPKGKQFLKRVIAIPGENVGVKRSSPYVKLDDTKYRFDVVGPYIRPDLFTESSWDRPPMVLQKNEYFVAGDNGYRSVDSRVWGPLKDKYIIGTAKWILWPLKDFGPLPPSDRISEITTNSNNK